MRPFIFLVICSGLISACTEYGRPESPLWFNKAPPEVIAAHYQGACLGYGYEPGTIGMRDCIAAEARAGRGAAHVQALSGMTAYSAVNAAVTQ